MLRTLPTVAARALALALLALVPACAGGAADGRVAPLAHAALEPGRGLGDITIGRTTLGEVVARYGVDRVSLFAGDEIALELVWARGGLALLVPVDRALADRVGFAALKSAVHDLEGFLADAPDAAELVVTSLSVDAGRTVAASFYQGSLTGGIRLGDPLADVVARLGEPDGSRAPELVAGMSPSLPEKRLVYASRGLVVYAVAVGEGDAEELVVRRMTVFAAAGS
jgi:hypothetical protein